MLGADTHGKHGLLYRNRHYVKYLIGTNPILQDLIGPRLDKPRTYYTRPPFTLVFILGSSFQSVVYSEGQTHGNLGSELRNGTIRKLGNADQPETKV